MTEGVHCPPHRCVRVNPTHRGKDLRQDACCAWSCEGDTDATAIPMSRGLCFAGAPVALTARRRPLLTHLGPGRPHSACPRMATTSPLRTARGTRQHVSAISSLKDVSYSISGVKVVEGISLDLWEGEIVAILGPSGSGKR
jgi:ABC-type glutathione transport system ATPase component